MKPRLLDLFCGAGGCSVGYHRAGFDVTGVDIELMPNYPFTFHQDHALDFLADNWRDFDVIHASPPCQASTALTKGTNRGRVAGMRHGQWYEGPYFAVYGEGGGKGTVAQWQEAMGIDWTNVRREIAEAIPPAYTEHIGAQLLDHLGRAAAW